jgi:hypothetical protein
MIDEQHLLFATATEEVVEATPAQLPRNARIYMHDVHDLMVISWLRGAAWATENPDLAKRAHDDANERRGK